MKTTPKERAERKARTERRRAQHHKSLETLALSVGCKTDGLTLWRKLRRLETKVYAACLSYSSDSSFGTDRWEKVKEAARIELASIFGGTIPKGVFINSDPRGSMLKLDTEEVPLPEGMQHDWGNYGMLAADINEED